MNIVLPPTSGFSIPLFLSQKYREQKPWHETFVEEKLYEFSGWHVGWNKKEFRFGMENTY